VNIYFSASIAGGRKYLKIYEQMVHFLKDQGHEIPTEHIIHPQVLQLEKSLTPEQIYNRDVEWIKNCDCVIAEVSNPSLGVGYEICYALRLAKPALCLYQKGLFISRMITGNTSSGLKVLEYGKDEDWKRSISEFLSSKTP